MEEKITQIKERFKKVKRIIISFIFLIIIFDIVLSCFAYNNLYAKSIVNCIILYIVSIVVIQILCSLLASINSIKEQEIENQILIKKLPGQYNLTKNYVELKIYKDIPKMRKLRNTGAKFYARLASEEEIEILVLLNGNEVKKELINDFVYFKEHYIPLE